jgi:hypothetical protein
VDAGRETGTHSSIQLQVIIFVICCCLISLIMLCVLYLWQGVALCDMWGSDSCVATDWSLLECYAMSTVNFRVKLSETHCCTRREVRMTGINSQWQWWCNDEVAGSFATQTGGWWGWGVECWAVWWQGRCVWNISLFINTHMTKFCNKRKVVPVHNMKAYRSIAPLTLNLGMRCKWVLNFMRWLLLPPVKGPLIPTE